MKFIISRLELNDLIARVQGAMSPRPTLAILSNVHVQAKDNEVVLTATDLTIGIRCYAEAKVLEEGTTTIPLKHFSQLVRELTAPNVEFTTRHDVTEVVAGASRFKLNGMSPTEYPALPDLEGATRFKVSQAALKDVLYRTSFAVARDDVRVVFTGVLMQVDQSIATFVATDGKRLSRAQLPIALPADYSGAFCIPLKAVAEISSNLTNDPDEMATVFLMNDRIAVEANHVTVSTKLLQGEYPDYAQVIPTTYETVLPVHREELISLLRQIALFTTESSQSVRFTFGEGELKLVKNANDVGEGQASMPIDYNGAKLEIAFSPHGMLDILKHCDNEIVSLGLIDSYNPGVVTELEDQSSKASSKGRLFVLMPMRLAEV